VNEVGGVADNQHRGILAGPVLPAAIQPGSPPWRVAAEQRLVLMFIIATWRGLTTAELVAGAR